MRILIPYDGSRNSLSALRLLASMALNPNSDILILKVVARKASFLPLPAFEDDPIKNQDEVNNHSMVLRELARELSLWQKNCNINYRVHFGKPAESILEVADQWKADLIILGPRRTQSSTHHFYMGSVSKEVTAKSTAPVLIVKPTEEVLEGQMGRLGYRVLVPIDGSLYSYYTISWLANQVWKAGTEFKILTAIPEFKEMSESSVGQYDPALISQWALMKEKAFESLEEHAFKLAECVGLENVSIDVEPGDPKKMIERVAADWSPDIIAMGAPRPAGINQIIMSDVPTHIAGRANCSILIVKRPGHGKQKRDDSGMKQALANVLDAPPDDNADPPHAVML